MRKGPRAVLLLLLLVSLVLPARADRAGRGPTPAPVEATDSDFNFSDLDVSFQNMNKPLLGVGAVGLAAALLIRNYRERARIESLRTRPSEALAQRFDELAEGCARNENEAKAALARMGISVTDLGTQLRFDGPPSIVSDDLETQIDEELSRIARETTSRHKLLEQLSAQLTGELMNARAEQVRLAQAEMRGAEGILDQQISADHSGEPLTDARRESDLILKQLRAARQSQSKSLVRVAELSAERMARRARNDEIGANLLKDKTRNAALAALHARTIGEGLQRVRERNETNDVEFREKLDQALAATHTLQSDIEVLATRYDALRPAGDQNLLAIAQIAEQKRQNVRSLRENLGADVRSFAVPFAERDAAAAAETAHVALAKATAGTIILSATKLDEVLDRQIQEAQKSIAGRQDLRAAAIADSPLLFANLARIAEYSDENFRTNFLPTKSDWESEPERIAFTTRFLNFIALSDTMSYEAHTQQVRLADFLDDEFSRQTGHRRGISQLRTPVDQLTTLRVLLHEYIIPALEDGKPVGKLMRKRAGNLLSLRFSTPVSDADTDPLVEFRDADHSNVREKVASAIGDAQYRTHVAVASLQTVTAESHSRRVVFRRGGPQCRALLAPETPNTLVVLPVTTE